MIETQMAVKAKQVTELETQAEYLEKTVPEKMDEIKAKKVKVEERFQQLKAPLLIRQQQLEKKKEAFQVTSLYLFFFATLIVQPPERYRPVYLTVTCSENACDGEQVTKALIPSTIAVAVPRRNCSNTTPDITHTRTSTPAYFFLCWAFIS